MRKNAPVIQFHNPGDEEETARYLYQIALRAGARKARELMVRQGAGEEEPCEHSGILQSING